MENQVISSGWPLGLEAMNMRLLVPASAGQHYSFHAPSGSFSSLLSSSLDTESTASFFQDHSMSLGHLTGIRRGDSGSLYFPNTIRFEEPDSVQRRGFESNGSKGYVIHLCQGICIPLLLCSTKKSDRSKSKAKT